MPEKMPAIPAEWPSGGLAGALAAEWGKGMNTTRRLAQAGQFRPTAFFPGGPGRGRKVERIGRFHNVLRRIYPGTAKTADLVFLKQGEAIVAPLRLKYQRHAAAPTPRPATPAGCFVIAVFTHMTSCSPQKTPPMTETTNLPA